MAPRASNLRRPKKEKRKGKPLTVYFAKDLADRLAVVSNQRHVAKAAVVRFALERLLDQLSNGQLELPLGL